MNPFSCKLSAAVVTGTLLCLIAAPLSAEDWPMLGRNSSRNPVSPETGAPRSWDLTRREGIKWTAQLGSDSLGAPVISEGLVWVGTNNARPRDPSVQIDASVLMCFRESDGAFLYQYVSPRLPSRSLDWPVTGLASSPLIEGDRLWFCTNRCEVVCLEIGPLKRGEGIPRVAWKIDLLKEYRVVPRGVHLAGLAIHSSVGTYRDLIYVNTTEAGLTDDAKLRNAPALLCLQKSDGSLRWRVEPLPNAIRGAQYGNPLVIEPGGRAQVIVGQGDGCLRSVDALTGQSLWSFDCHSTGSRPGRKEQRNLIPAPMFHDDRVYFALGRDLETCGEQGALYCIAPHRSGDISEAVVNDAGEVVPNANSGLIWKYEGQGDAEEGQMHCSLATPAIHAGRLVIPDSHGIVHCVDSRTGKGLWSHATGDTLSGSALIVDGLVYVGGIPSGAVSIFELAGSGRLATEIPCGYRAIDVAPVFANGVLYVTTRSELLAIGR